MRVLGRTITPNPREQAKLPESQLQCFVSGHDFSRAVDALQDPGFSPWASFDREYSPRTPQPKPGLNRLHKVRQVKRIPASYI